MSKAVSVRTDYQGEPLSGPGILWINSKVTKPEELPIEVFERWYETVHIPDLIAAKPGGILASWRYKCVDPSREAPFLAVYSVPDLGFLQSKEFKAVPMTDEMLPDNGPIHLFAEFDARFYKRVQVFETEKSKPGNFDFICRSHFQLINMFSSIQVAVACSFLPPWNPLM